MNYKPFLSMVDRLRGDLPKPQEAMLLTAAILTWQHLGRLGHIASEFTLTSELAASPRDAAQALKQVGKDLKVMAFEGAARLLDSINQRTAMVILQTALRTEELDKLEQFDPTDIAIAMGGPRRGGLPFLPSEVCDLMLAIALGDKAVQGEVYLPWDDSGQFLGRWLIRGGTVALETPNATSHDFAELMRAYFEWPTRSQLACVDPIRDPSFQDKGVLRQFDLVIASPPFGARSDQWDPTLDSFERFPEKTNSLTVLAIRHVLAQTQGRAVIAVSNSVLFASGAERRLRKDLLDAGLVKAVIGLPSGLLADTNIAFALLVLDKNKHHDTVRFVNCDSDHFKEAESRTRFTLKSLFDIVDLTLGHASGPHAANVQVKDLQGTEWNLLPSRYVVDDTMSQADRVLERYQLVALGEIAEVIRPLAETEIIDPIDVLEVGTADIQVGGFIPHPTRNISVSGGRTKGGAVFLQPYDLVFVIKGSVGKVSIAPESTPKPGPGGWVVGQSMAVVRFSKPANYCKAMAVLFRSDVGQELLRRLVAGAAIPFLQIRELRQLQLPVVLENEVMESAKVLDAQEDLRRQILQLQTVLDSTKHPHWCYPNAGSDTGSAE